MKTCSFGGLGDSFIIFLKLDKLQRSGVEITEHKFIESNLRTLRWIQECIKILPSEFDNINFTFGYDENYQKSFFEGAWKGYEPINTAWHGDYHFPKPDGIKLDNIVDSTLVFDGLFSENDNLISFEMNYDIAIQVSGGVNANRKWRFDPITLAKILRKKGYRVCLVGYDQKFVDESDADNFVCKTDLIGSIKKIFSSCVYVGLSGFHSYWTLSSGIPNVMLEESQEHTNHYIPPEWEKHLYFCEHGSTKEVMDGIRFFMERDSETIDEIEKIIG